VLAARSNGWGGLLALSCLTEGAPDGASRSRLPRVPAPARSDAAGPPRALREGVTRVTGGADSAYGMTARPVPSSVILCRRIRSDITPNIGTDFSPAIRQAFRCHCASFTERAFGPNQKPSPVFNRKECHSVNSQTCLRRPEGAARGLVRRSEMGAKASGSREWEGVAGTGLRTERQACVQPGPRFAGLPGSFGTAVRGSAPGGPRRPWC